MSQRARGQSIRGRFLIETNREHEEMKKQRAGLAALWAAAMAATAPEAAAREWTADANGCKVWNTRPAMKEAVEWTGACVDGLAEGSGRLRWTVNGQPTRTYEGGMKAGRRSGQGVATMELGIRYEGGFLEDDYAGQGSLFYASGASSRGEFVAGRLQGNCTLTSASGARYEGECKAGRPDGAATIHFANGDRYAGAQRFGTPAGHGRYQWARGDTYEGEFVSGKLAGTGSYRFADGSRYEGKFSDGLPAGPGRLEMADGLGFDGHFEAGLPASPGALFKAGTTAPEDSPQLRTRLSLPYAKPMSLSAVRPLASVGMVCRTMARPQVPAIQWKGQALYRAVATVRDGRVVEVEFTPLLPGIDPVAQRAFITSIEHALRNYDCPGNHVFEQEFQFKYD